MVGKQKVVAHLPKQSEGKEKEKQLRDKNAPKIPMNAYQRYVTHRLKVSPSKKFGTSREAMANFAAEWATMEPQKKKPFFDEYIAERSEYCRKMEDYKKTADYKSFQMQKTAKHRKMAKISTGQRIGGHFRPLHLPPNVKQIFSREFLEYNKGQEKRMRDIRAQISEVEDQIERLDRHIVSLNDQMCAVQSATRAEEAATAQMSNQMRQWCHIVRDALGMDADASLEAVIESAEQLMDERNDAGSDTAEMKRAREALQQAMRKADGKAAVPNDNPRPKKPLDSGK